MPPMQESLSVEVLIKELCLPFLNVIFYLAQYNLQYVINRPKKSHNLLFKTKNFLIQSIFYVTAHSNSIVNLFSQPYQTHFNCVIATCG